MRLIDKHDFKLSKVFDCPPRLLRYDIMAAKESRKHQDGQATVFTTSPNFVCNDQDLSPYQTITNFVDNNYINDSFVFSDNIQQLCSQQPAMQPQMQQQQQQPQQPQSYILNPPAKITFNSPMSSVPILQIAFEANAVANMSSPQPNDHQNGDPKCGSPDKEHADLAPSSDSLASKTLSPCLSSKTKTDDTIPLTLYKVLERRKVSGSNSTHSRDKKPNSKFQVLITGDSTKREKSLTEKISETLNIGKNDSNSKRKNSNPKKPRSSSSRHRRSSSHHRHSKSPSKKSSDFKYESSASSIHNFVKNQLKALDKTNNNLDEEMPRGELIELLGKLFGFIKNEPNKVYKNINLDEKKPVKSESKTKKMTENEKILEQQKQEHNEILQSLKFLLQKNKIMQSQDFASEAARNELEKQIHSKYTRAVNKCHENDINTIKEVDEISKGSRISDAEDFQEACNRSNQQLILEKFQREQQRASRQGKEKKIKEQPNCRKRPQGSTNNNLPFEDEEEEESISTTSLSEQSCAEDPIVQDDQMQQEIIIKETFQQKEQKNKQRQQQQQRHQQMPKPLQQTVHLRDANQNENQRQRFQTLQPRKSSSLNQEHQERSKKTKREKVSQKRKMQQQPQQQPEKHLQPQNQPHQQPPQSQQQPQQQPQKPQPQPQLQQQQHQQSSHKHENLLQQCPQHQKQESCHQQTSQIQQKQQSQPLPPQQQQQQQPQQQQQQPIQSHVPSNNFVRHPNEQGSQQWNELSQNKPQTTQQQILQSQPQQCQQTLQQQQQPQQISQQLHQTLQPQPIPQQPSQVPPQQRQQIPYQHVPKNTREPQIFPQEQQSFVEKTTMYYCSSLVADAQQQYSALDQRNIHPQESRHLHQPTSMQSNKQQFQQFNCSLVRQERYTENLNSLAERVVGQIQTSPNNLNYQQCNRQNYDELSATSNFPPPHHTSRVDASHQTTIPFSIPQQQQQQNEHIHRSGNCQQNSGNKQYPDELIPMNLERPPVLCQQFVAYSADYSQLESVPNSQFYSQQIPEKQPQNILLPQKFQTDSSQNSTRLTTDKLPNRITVGIQTTTPRYVCNDKPLAKVALPTYNNANVASKHREPLAELKQLNKHNITTSANQKLTRSNAKRSENTQPLRKLVDEVFEKPSQSVQRILEQCSSMDLYHEKDGPTFINDSTSKQSIYEFSRNDKFHEEHVISTWVVGAGDLIISKEHSTYNNKTSNNRFTRVYNTARKEGECEQSFETEQSKSSTPLNENADYFSRKDAFKTFKKLDEMNFLKKTLLEIQPGTTNTIETEGASMPSRFDQCRFRPHQPKTRQLSECHRLRHQKQSLKPEHRSQKDKLNHILKLKELAKKYHNRFSPKKIIMADESWTESDTFSEMICQTTPQDTIMRTATKRAFLKKVEPDEDLTEVPSTFDVDRSDNDVCNGVETSKGFQQNDPVLTARTEPIMKTGRETVVDDKRNHTSRSVVNRGEKKLIK